MPRRDATREGALAMAYMKKKTASPKAAMTRARAAWG